MKYISHYFLSTTFVLGLIAVVNWYMDPFAMYWSPLHHSINEFKTEAGTRSRITKIHQVQRVSPEILLVGNSRIEMGISPRSPLFGDKTIYNQGMPGAHVIMQLDYAIDAIKTTPNIKQLFVSVDFLDFLLNKKQSSLSANDLTHSIRSSYKFRLKSFDDGLSARVARFKEQSGLIFSLDALTASVNTLVKQNTNTSSIDEYGFNTALSYIDIMKNEGIRPLFTQKLEEISSRLKEPVSITSFDNVDTSPYIEHLVQFIDFAQQRNIKITLFINPYHYSYLHTLADSQQWTNFQQWKRLLTHNISDRYTNNVVLWDFSGFNTITNEKVTIETPSQHMKWFWEPAHYRKELGEIMLRKMTLNLVNSYSYFGVKLTNENITTVIENDKINLQKTEAQWLQLKEKLNIH